MNDNPTQAAVRVVIEGMIVQTFMFRLALTVGLGRRSTISDQVFECRNIECFFPSQLVLDEFNRVSSDSESILREGKLA